MAQRLIDAERLKRHYSWWGAENASEMLKEFKHTFDIIVDLQPTVEAAKVIRCKECSYHELDGDGDDWCVWSGNNIKPTDFCSMGERRPDDAEQS